MLIKMLMLILKSRRPLVDVDVDMNVVNDIIVDIISYCC